MLQPVISLLRQMRLAWRCNEMTSVRLRLLWTVCRLFVKGSLLFCWPRKRRRSDAFLGFRLTFPSFRTYAFLFHTIFLRRDYAFACRSPKPLIIDCGSNIGMSVLWFKWKRPQARVIAFEPDEQAFACLTANVQDNGLTNVELHRLALASRPGQRPLYYDAGDPASLGTSLTERLYEYADKKVAQRTVECVPLSRFLDEPIDILKLDVEGSETEVLDDLARHDRLRGIGELFIEYHYNESNPGNSLAHVLTLLENHGYRYVITPGRIGPHIRLRQRPFKLNIYAYTQTCVRPDRAPHASASARVEDLASCP